VILTSTTTFLSYTLKCKALNLSVKFVFGIHFNSLFCRVEFSGFEDRGFVSYCICDFIVFYVPGILTHGLLSWVV
jgi:hypothetical protein